MYSMNNVVLINGIAIKKNREVILLMGHRGDESSRDAGIDCSQSCCNSRSRALCRTTFAYLVVPR